MNLWHEVPHGKDFPKEANVIIEIPRNAKNKYEIDKDTGLIKLDRASKSGQDYPFDYGFVPQTLWDDDDALDVVLLTTYPLSPGILVVARPVGILRMIDDGDSDDKIIAVPTEDPRWDKTQDLTDVNEHTLKEIKHFFETYKTIENKVVECKEYLGAADAREALARSVELYEKKFKK